MEFCATHTYLEFKGRKDWKVGDQFFPSCSPVKELASLKRVLCLIGAPNYSCMTWKSVRAGRASAMAAAGCTLGEILGAGEWRSMAYLRYVSEEVADAGQVLRTTLQRELDEEVDDM